MTKLIKCDKRKKLKQIGVLLIIRLKRMYIQYDKKVNSHKHKLINPGFLLVMSQFFLI